MSNPMDRLLSGRMSIAEARENVGRLEAAKQVAQQEDQAVGALRFIAQHAQAQTEMLQQQNQLLQAILQAVSRSSKSDDDEMTG